MADFLTQVISERREDLASGNAPKVVAPSGPAPSFVDALRACRSAGRLAVIAEVKRVSPALGPLNLGLDPADLARSYEAAGATAISVITEPRHWGGSLEDLAAVREAVSLPLLCKDVIIDARQLHSAQRAGASAVLLIAEALTDTELSDLLNVAAELELTALVEAHEPAAFARAVASGASVVGVNARDLRRPKTIISGRVHELYGLVASNQLLIAESGISSADDARALPGRVDAVLVGTALVRAEDPGPLLASLVAVPRQVVA